MDFKKELAEYGYNLGNAIDVETLIDEILPSLFSKQERSYSEEEVKKLAFDFYHYMCHNMDVSENLISENETNVDIWFEQFKKK